MGWTIYKVKAAPPDSLSQVNGSKFGPSAVSIVDLLRLIQDARSQRLPTTGAAIGGDTANGTSYGTGFCAFTVGSGEQLLQLGQ